MIPFKFENAFLQSTPLNYGGIYSVLMAGYYYKIVDTLEKDDTVLDGGANVGAFSIAVSRRVKRVISVEPNQKNYKLLLQNLKMNDATNITPVNAALTDRIGSIGFEGDGEIGHVSRYGTEILTTTIDELEKNFQVKFDALKLDLEGAEPLAIMGGAGEAIRHVSKLIFEVDRGQLKATTNSLEGLSIYDYENLIEKLKKDGFEIDTFKPDKERYKLLWNNIRAGNIKMRHIARNEILHGFWYTRHAVSEFFSRMASKGEVVPSWIEMVYASRSKSHFHP